MARDITDNFNFNKKVEQKNELLRRENFSERLNIILKSLSFSFEI